MSSECFRLFVLIHLAPKPIVGARAPNSSSMDVTSPEVTFVLDDKVAKINYVGRTGEGATWTMREVGRAPRSTTVMRRRLVKASRLAAQTQWEALESRPGHARARMRWLQRS